MPNDDPQYVRLANRLSRGILADVEGSGWSISGLDVKEFPKDNTNAARFVRHALRDGKLEPASRAEHEEVQSEVEALNDVTHQEAKVMGAALDGHARLSESRSSADEGDDEDEEDRLRQFDDETDDPEEQASRNTQRRGTATATKSKSKAKKSKAKEAADSGD